MAKIYDSKFVLSIHKVGFFWFYVYFWFHWNYYSFKITTGVNVTRDAQGYL